MELLWQVPLAALAVVLIAGAVIQGLALVGLAVYVAGRAAIVVVMVPALALRAAARRLGGQSGSD